MASRNKFWPFEKAENKLAFIIILGHFAEEIYIKALSETESVYIISGII